MSETPGRVLHGLLFDEGMVDPCWDEYNEEWQGKFAAVAAALLAAVDADTLIEEMCRRGYVFEGDE